MEKEILEMEAKYQGIDLLDAHVIKEDPVEKEKERQRIIAKQLEINGFIKKNKNLKKVKAENDQNI
jgi:hypothetical protein